MFLWDLSNAAHKKLQRMLLHFSVQTYHAVGEFINVSYLHYLTLLIHTKSHSQNLS